MRSLYLRPLLLAATFATAIAPAFLAGCDAADAVGGADLATGSAAESESLIDIVVSGTITSNTTWTRNNTYILDGIVEVDNNAVLTIESGTTIKGSTNQPSALLINQGSRIEANGTATQPIVFTSNNPVGSRAPGDWGGVILIGNSTCNGADTNDCFVEGIPGAPETYGGNPIVLNDNSGTLRYVRIEFAGFELEPGSEINGLTLYSVGSGTTIEYVQVHKGSDDGVELFGGTVDLKRIVVTGAQDDSFDYSYGWTGRAQFLVALQDEAVGDKGIEADNNEIRNGSTDYFNRPLTDPTIYNMTFVGRYPSGVGSANVGMHLRRGVGGDIRNIILVGFGSYAIDIDDDATYTNCATDTDVDDLRIGSVITWLSGIAQYDTDTDNELQCVDQQKVRNQDPRLRNLSRARPDFRPRNVSLVTNPQLVRTPPPDAFFEPVSYVGAVDPNAPTTAIFYFGWTTFAQN